MPLMEKRRRVNDARRPGYVVFKRRPRFGLFVLVLLTPLVLCGLGSYLSASIFEGTGGGSSRQAGRSPVEKRTSESTVDEEKVTDEREPGSAAAPKIPPSTFPKTGALR
jgi:hypothetical protein